MKNIYVIQQLFLEKGVLKSKVGRSSKRVHYRQGELDGACGAYSIAMSLNIVGAFDAEFLNQEAHNVDFRTAEGKMHRAIHGWGLYPNGLTIENCIKILQEYKSKSSYKVIEASSDIIRSYIDKDIPIILGIDYKGGGHWIVVVGYELKNNEVENLYTIDPGCKLPTSAYWNGVISMKQISGMHYRYNYNADKLGSKGGNW